MIRKCLGFLFIVPLFLTGCFEENKKSEGSFIYHVATSADYPPFEYLKDGQIVGFDIDLINAVADKMGIKIQINDMPFEGILGSLISKRTDMAISYISATQERKKALDFSNEYYVSTQRALVCSNASAVHTLTDLTGKVIGVQAGSIHEIFAHNALKKKTPSLTVKSLPRIPELVQEVKTHRISCILMGDKEAERLIKNHEELRVVKGDSEDLEGISIAFPKGSPLREKMNRALVDLTRDGTIEHLRKKWLSE